MSNPGPATTVTIHPQSITSNQAQRLLAYGKGVSLAATGDAAILPLINCATFVVTNVIITNASADVHTGALGVFTAAAAGGTAIVSNAALTSNTAATYVTNATVATTATNFSVPSIYVNVGTAVAGTVDIYVYGYDLSGF